MKVLVTGGTGFVGSHLAEALVQQGYDVSVLVRHQSNTTFLKRLGVEIISGDIRDNDVVEKAVSTCQQVYHLAGKISRAKPSIGQYYAVNVEGTKNMARAATRTNVERFVHVSSAGIYGVISHPPANEQTQPRPNTPYRESKFAGEEAVLSYYKREGLPVVIARLSSVIGPRGLNWLSLCQAISKNHFRMISTGENYFDLVYITDVIDGLRRCAETENIIGETYVLAGEKPIMLKNFIQMIMHELGIERAYGSAPSWPFQVYFSLSQAIKNMIGFDLPASHRYEMFLTSRLFDISKARTQLGYHPIIPIEQGLRQTIAWYQEHGYL